MSSFLILLSSVRQKEVANLNGAGAMFARASGKGSPRQQGRAKKGRGREEGPGGEEKHAGRNKRQARDNGECPQADTYHEGGDSKQQSWLAERKQIVERRTRLETLTRRYEQEAAEAARITEKIGEVNDHVPDNGLMVAASPARDADMQPGRTLSGCSTDKDPNQDEAALRAQLISFGASADVLRGLSRDDLMKMYVFFVVSRQGAMASFPASLAPADVIPRWESVPPALGRDWVSAVCSTSLSLAVFIAPQLTSIHRALL